MISQNNNQIPNQKKGGNTMYKLDYKEHNILKQAAYKIMQNYNNRQYHSNNKNKQFIKYNQTLQLLYKTKTKEQLLDIIDKYQRQQEKQNNKKLIQHNQTQIIIPKLQNLTDKQVEQIATKLQELEKHYYLQLDTNYNSKQSIIQSYQQVLAYKYYKIPVQPKETEQPILIGNLEILEKGAIQC
jgi:hypothetical protein